MLDLRKCVSLKFSASFVRIPAYPLPSSIGGIMQLLELRCRWLFGSFRFHGSYLVFS